MSQHPTPPPHILDGKLEPEVRDSGDERVPLYSIAISLKRIADTLAEADDQSQPHPDDAAADRFAADIKAALARARRSGRDGWQDANVITTGGLAQQMAAQFLKRTPSTWVDIAAYAMMLHFRGADPSVLAEAIRAAPSPEGPTPEEAAGPVINGRVLKAGDRVRFRDGSTGGVVSVTAAAPRIYPWSVRIDGVGEFKCTKFGMFYAGSVHDKKDITAILDDAGADPASPPASVDLSQLRPGDVIRFASGWMALVREVEPVEDGYCVAALDARIERPRAVRFSPAGRPMGLHAGGEPIVEIIKGKRDE